MKEELIQIAGKNVLGINSKNVEKMVKCLNYLDSQIAMISNETKDDMIQDRIKEVRNIAVEILQES